MIIKLNAAGYYKPVSIEDEGKLLRLKFAYSKSLLSEIKAMDGAKWCPETKSWTINNSARNKFQLDYLQGKNPYQPYDIPLVDYQPKRNLYDHQVTMVKTILTRKRCILACEMGCLHGNHPIGGNLVKDYYENNTLPTVRCYNEDGDILQVKASRIIKKRQKLYRVNDILVGESHLFLTKLEGRLCHTRTMNLTCKHVLLTERLPGSMTISRQSQQSNKPTGWESGMEMVQSTSKIIITGVNCILQMLNMSDNLPETLSALRFLITERLSYLGLTGLSCQQKSIVYGQKCTQDCIGISFEDYLMQMGQSQSQTTGHTVETFIGLYAMLQDSYLLMLQEYLAARLSKDKVQTNCQSMEEDVFKVLQTIYIRIQQDFLKEKQTSFEKPGQFILMSESEHIIPASCHNLKELEVKSVTNLGIETDTYDLTIPTYGNYFDDYGINHQNTGKSLAAIEAAEIIKPLNPWYIGPKAGVVAVKRELAKWESQIQFRMMTYEELTKLMIQWKESYVVPDYVVFDESSKIKTPTAQRSQAAKHLSESVLSKDGYIILMSGTPAPKTPLDWWHQCEVACPGYIREGNLGKFKQRLCIIESRQSIAGGMYPHIVTWKDDENKCDVCGREREAANHSNFGLVTDLDPDQIHEFKSSKNEIAFLYERMKGLVLVQFKKDCLDLPEKQYQIIKIKPTVDILRACKLITAQSTRAIEALTLMRELSDGFQYKENKIGMQSCPNCNGLKVEPDYTHPATDDKPQEMMTCGYCGGSGEVPKYERETVSIGSPKDDILKDLLDEQEDYGRYIVWAGFTGSIDRLVELIRLEGWYILRVDGRGYHGFTPKGEVVDYTELLDSMDASHPKRKEFQEKYPKVCFVGHPQAGGMALTLTGSNVELFYSNCFNGEARMQAEDRFHRAGMDANRGATIIDMIMLPTDQLVLDNLKRKRDLQNLTMGELKDNLKEEIA